MITPEAVQAALEALNEAYDAATRSSSNYRDCCEALAEAEDDLVSTNQRVDDATAAYHALRGAYLDQEAQEPAP